MSINAQAVRDFIRDWSTLDVEAIVSYFSEDGVYHNMPMAPVVGRDRIRPFIKGFIKDWTATTWEILSLVESNDLVVAERVDRTHVGDKLIELPCCGVFEMHNGKIRVWRDYFDLGAYARAVAR